MASEVRVEASSGTFSSDLCLYSRHACSRPRYQKYRYCVEHILEDNTSPFTSCEYTSRTSGRKCPNPALRSRRTHNLPSFCDEHLRDLIAKEQYQKQKKKLRRRRKVEKLHKESPAHAKRQKLINRLVVHRHKNAKTLSRNGSDSDAEIVHRPVKDGWLLENSEDTGSNADWDDFDPVNNEVYEPLRYADVLTPEEVVATAQSKLIRLQSLYIEQFKRLFHLLKERRRQYLHDKKKELKEEKAAGGQHLRGDDSVDEDEIYALATCRKRTGVDALLRKKQQKRRLESSGTVSNFVSKSPPSLSRCSHISNHSRCRGSCLPYTKYCTLHILEDPHQLLYTKCHNDYCTTPVCFLTSRPYKKAAGDDNSQNEEVCYCTIHAPLAEMTFTFPEVKKEEEDMEVDVVGSLEAVNDEPEQLSELKFSEIKPEVEESTGRSAQQSNTDRSEGGVRGQAEDDASDGGQRPCSGVKVSEKSGDFAEPNDFTSAAKSGDINPSNTPCRVEGTEDVPLSSIADDIKGTTGTESESVYLHPTLPDPLPADIPIHSPDRKTFVREAKMSEAPAQQSFEDANFLVDPVTGLLVEESGDRDRSPSLLSTTASNANNNSSADASSHRTNLERNYRDLEGDSTEKSDLVPPATTSLMPTFIRRAERKPSSAEEELAVVSLLSLCSGHPSDDNTPSSSTDQD